MTERASTNQISATNGDWLPRVRRWLGVSEGRKRLLLSLSCVVALATTGIALASDKPTFRSLKPQSISVIARPIAGFEKSNPEVKKFGRLIWRGGLQLSSPAAQFGGFSGLRLDAKGEKIVAISDAGTWLRASVTYDKNKLSGLKNAEMAPLRKLSGDRLNRNRDRDAEALAIMKGTINKGSVLIAFERNDRIGVFPISKKGIGTPKRYLKLPNAIRRNRRGNGVEGLVVLSGGKRKGSLLVFMEDQPSSQRLHPGWLITRGNAKQLSIKDRGGFAITDLAGLPDGSVLVLERRFRWSEGVKMRLRHLSAQSIKPGAQLDGEILLEADMSKQIDNMEGIAVHHDRRGRTIVTLISDNNFNSFLQRTLLLQFELTGTKKSKSAARGQRGSAVH